MLSWLSKYLSQGCAKSLKYCSFAQETPQKLFYLPLAAEENAIAVDFSYEYQLSCQEKSPQMNWGVRDGSCWS